MKLKKIAVLVGLLLTACSMDLLTGKGKIVSVNGVTITEENLEFLGGINPNIARQLSSPFGKKQIIDNLVEQELLYQEAKKESLQREKGVQEKIKLYKKVILAQSLVEREAEREARAEYDSKPQDYERLRLAMIEILFENPDKSVKDAKSEKRSEQEAQEVADKVFKETQTGKNLSDLAAVYTDDVRGQKTGGDQGFVTRSEPRLVRRGLQPVVEKAFQMKVGEVSEPIRTDNGFFLIAVTAPMERLPFEQVKEEILYTLLPKTRDRLLGELKAKARLQYAEGFEPSLPKASAGGGAAGAAPSVAAPGVASPGTDNAKTVKTEPDKATTGGGKVPVSGNEPSHPHEAEKDGHSH